MGVTVSCESRDVSRVAVDQLDDGMEGRPWLPCPLTGWAGWCAKFHDIWATSLIFRGSATALYQQHLAGIVLAPTVAINCAYPHGARAHGRLHPCSVVAGVPSYARSRAACGCACA